MCTDARLVDCVLGRGWVVDDLDVGRRRRDALVEKGLLDPKPQREALHELPGEERQARIVPSELSAERVLVRRPLVLVVQRALRGRQDGRGGVCIWLVGDEEGFLAVCIWRGLHPRH